MLKIYSKESCPQCTQLELLLKSRNMKFQTLKLDKDYTREDLAVLFEVLELAQPRSFPILFKDEVFVGGLIEAKIALIKGTL